MSYSYGIYGRALIILLFLSFFMLRALHTIPKVKVIIRLHSQALHLYTFPFSVRAWRMLDRSIMRAFSLDLFSSHIRSEETHVYNTHVEPSVCSIFQARQNSTCVLMHDGQDPAESHGNPMKDKVGFCWDLPSRREHMMHRIPELYIPVFSLSSGI